MWGSPIEPSENDPHRRAIAEAIEKLKALLEALRVAVAGVTGSDSLSEKGKSVRLGELAGEYLSRIGKFHQVVTKQGDNVTKLRAKTKIDLPAGDPAVREQRAVELRASMKGKEPHEVYLQFELSARTDDRETFFALRNAPALLNVLTPEQIAVGEGILARTLNPETAEAADVLEGDVQTLKRVLHSVTSEVYKLTGMSGPDAISIAAKAGVK